MSEVRDPKALYKNIAWEDEDEQGVQPVASDEEFATLLAGDAARTFAPIRPGDTVAGKILSIGAETIVLDVGQRSEGTIDTAQFSPDELAKFKVGDELRLFVAHVSAAGIELAKSLKSKDLSKDKLYEAMHSGVPIEGKVVGENKGGYTVEIAGGKGFVPFSQMDVGPSKGAATYLGKTLRFRVAQIKGRDIVLSRAALLREEQAEAQAKILHEIAPEQVRAATVVKREKFGIFVDLGAGLTALLPASEVSYSRASDILDKFAIGDTLQVKIISVDRSGARPRIAASLKQLGGDPWDLAVDRLAVGAVVSGEVTRLAAFGAFVELFPGVDGLVHISELSARKRVSQPGEVVKVGDKIQVKVLAVDRIQKRISLSCKALDADADAAIDPDLKQKYMPAESAKQNDQVDYVDVRVKGNNAFASAFAKAKQDHK